MVAPAVEGIDLFKIAGRSISNWIHSFKTGTAGSVRQPFCSQLEERLLLWLEYHPQVTHYARGDIGPQFAATYRLPAPSDTPFAIGYTFEGKPQLNLRLWGGSIYTWLTQPILDPTASGHVTMDYLMKLMTTALEWTYQAGETDVRAETLEAAASLLVLRRDTLWIIDGAGPCVEVPPSESPVQENGSGADPEWEAVQANVQQNTAETGGMVEEQAQTGKTPKCTFSGIVSIDLERFLASSTHLIECPGCGRTRTLSPKNGVLRFPSHDKYKIHTPNTDQRLVQGESAWKVVGAK